MILTANDAALLETHLRKIEGKMFRTARDWQAAFQKLLHEQEYEYIREQITKQHIDLEDSNATQEFISTFRAEISSLPNIVIRLAFRPRRAFVEEIIKWLSRSGASKGKVTFIYSPDIVAGIILEYDGIIYNHSAVKKIDEELSVLSR